LIKPASNMNPAMIRKDCKVREEGCMLVEGRFGQAVGLVQGLTPS
jgi:hypothetical protein